MEIKGNEFIKTVQIRQEKEDIQKRLEALQEEDENVTLPENPNRNNPYEEQIMQTESELDDIMLQTPAPQNNENNKKKYVVLGLLLIVLFLLTVIVFRFLTNPTDESLIAEDTTIKQENVLNGDNIEQQYQKIINEKLKNIKDKTIETEIEKKSSKASMELTDIEKEEQKLPFIKKKEEDLKKTQALKDDIFGVKNGQTTTTKITKVTKVEKKVISKPVVKKTPIVKKAPVKTTKVSTSSKPEGTFIQLIALTKNIDPKYLKNLKAKKIDYIIYKESVKGTTYTKVLAGPFKNRTDALNSNVVKELKINKPYIRSF